jgi:hypothetical protein
VQTVLIRPSRKGSKQMGQSSPLELDASRKNRRKLFDALLLLRNMLFFPLFHVFNSLFC